MKILTGFKTATAATLVVLFSLSASAAQPPPWEEIHFAIREKNDVAIVRALLAANPKLANIPSIASKGASAGSIVQTPLTHAVSRANREILTLLLANNADVNIVASQGTALQCVMYGIYPSTNAMTRLEVVKLLFEHKADVNLPDRRGLTPLTVAVYYAHSDVVPTLLEHGADLKVKELLRNAVIPPAGFATGLSSGKEPARILEAKKAFMARRESILELLLQKGADPNAKTEAGKTPLQICLSQDQDFFGNLTAILRKHGAKE